MVDGLESNAVVLVNVAGDRRIALVLVFLSPRKKKNQINDPLESAETPNDDQKDQSL